MKLKRGNVIKNKKTGNKICVFTDCEKPDDEWEFVCEHPHEDEDMSYICIRHEYCRCSQ